MKIKIQQRATDKKVHEAYSEFLTSCKIKNLSIRSIHLFRHTFVKKWILARGDILRLQKILGHSSLEIVREYVNMFEDGLKKDFDKLNPLEQLTNNKYFIKL